MDIIDKVTYDFQWDNEKDLSEETRKAFISVFNSEDSDALLVARYLVQICKWNDLSEYSDPIIGAKISALKNVIMSIKKQLNQKEIEREDYE